MSSWPKSPSFGSSKANWNKVNREDHFQSFTICNVIASYSTIFLTNKRLNPLRSQFLLIFNMQEKLLCFVTIFLFLKNGNAVTKTTSIFRNIAIDTSIHCIFSNANKIFPGKTKTFTSIGPQQDCTRKCCHIQRENNLFLYPIFISTRF